MTNNYGSKAKAEAYDGCGDGGCGGSGGGGGQVAMVGTPRMAAVGTSKGTETVTGATAAASRRRRHTPRGAHLSQPPVRLGGRRPSRRRPLRPRPSRPIPPLQPWPHGRRRPALPAVTATGGKGGDGGRCRSRWRQRSQRRWRWPPLWRWRLRRPGRSRRARERDSGEEATCEWLALPIRLSDRKNCDRGLSGT